MPIQIWQHNPSGEKYAVELDSSGKVVSASVDLHHSEVKQALDWFNNDPEQVEWIRENLEDFTVHLQAK